MNDATPAPEPPPRPAAPSIVRAALQLLLGVGIFALILWWVAPPWEEIRQLVSLSVGWLVVSFAGSAFATLVTAARWKTLSEAMGASPMRYGVYFHYLALTRVLGQVLPNMFVDLVGRGAALRAAGNRSGLGHLIAPVVLERVLDFLLPCAMLVWALPFALGQEHAALGPWGSLATVVVVFSVLAVPLLRPLAALALRLLGWVRRLRHREAVLPPAPQVPRPLAMQIVGFSLGRYVGILVQYGGAGAGFGVALPALVLLAAAPLAQLAGLVGITPGGLGIQEAGWVGGLARLGTPEAAIVVFMAATRLMMVVNFGLLTLLSWRWRVHEDPGTRGRS